MPLLRGLALGLLPALSGRRTLRVAVPGLLDLPQGDAGRLLLQLPGSGAANSSCKYTPSTDTQAGLCSHVELAVGTLHTEQHSNMA
jgi:hypothetical protein